MTTLKYICIDLSGTLHVGNEPTDGAVEALKRLRTSNIPIRFITNTTKESTETLHKTLRRIGFELDLEEIYSSLSAARDYVIKKELRPLYLLTTDACNGFPQTDDGHHNAVVVGLAPEMFNYETMNRAFNILLNPACPLIAIHIGKYYKSQEKGLALGPGGFVQALEYAANCKATVVGKPNAYFFRSAVPAEVRMEECVMIGDDPLDDAKGAIDVGMKAILVKTGKYRPEIDSHCHHLADNFSAAVDKLFAVDFKM